MFLGVFSIAFAAHASAAAVLATPDVTLSNVSSNGLPPSINGSDVDGDIWSWYCTRAPGWYDPAMNPDDCVGVIEYLYLETMHEGGRKPMEFVAPDAKTASYVEAQKTPRKYTFGTCTLALVMVQDFPNPASLPGGSKTGPPTDHSTYFTLLKVAQNVVQQCVQRRSEMGWQQAGLKRGIGVFIWSTSSEQDLLIEADEPRYSFPVLEKLGNGSAAGV